MRRMHSIPTLAILAVLAMPTSAVADGIDPGQAAFLEAKCNMCHSVPSAEIEAKIKVEKMKGPDLVRSTIEADTLRAYLKKDVELNDALHKKGFTGSDEELAAIVAWLRALPEG